MLKYIITKTFSEKCVNRVRTLQMFELSICSSFVRNMYLTHIGWRQVQCKQFKWIMTPVKTVEANTEYRDDEQSAAFSDWQLNDKSIKRYIKQMRPWLSTMLKKQAVLVMTSAGNYDFCWKSSECKVSLEGVVLLSHSLGVQYQIVKVCFCSTTLEFFKQGR